MSTSKTKTDIKFVTSLPAVNYFTPSKLSEVPPMGELYRLRDLVPPITKQGNSTESRKTVVRLSVYQVI